MSGSTTGGWNGKNPLPRSRFMVLRSRINEGERAIGSSAPIFID